MNVNILHNFLPINSDNKGHKNIKKEKKLVEKC